MYKAVLFVFGGENQASIFLFWTQNLSVNNEVMIYEVLLYKCVYEITQMVECSL